MLFIYLGLYTLLLCMVWGFCIVAKIHAYKFKNFSYHIKQVTVFLLITLLALSILGYICIIFIGPQGGTHTIDGSDRQKNIMQEIEY